MSTNALIGGRVPADRFSIPDPSTWMPKSRRSFAPSPSPQVNRPAALQYSPMSSRTSSKHNAALPLHSVTAQGDGPANVVIEIGTERKKYHIQKAFLMHHSEYFGKALIGTWKEAEDGVVSLDDIEPAVFNLFVEWLYTQQVPKTVPDYNRIAYGGPRLISDNLLLQVKLYVFADRFAVPALRTAMNREIVGSTYSPAAWYYTMIIYAFSNLPPTDPLLDLFADQHYINWSGRGTSIEGLPEDFLQRFVQRIGMGRMEGREVVSDIFKMDLCTYHEHETDAEKRYCSHRSSTVVGRVTLTRPIRSDAGPKSMMGFTRPSTSSS